MSHFYFLYTDKHKGLLRAMLGAQIFKIITHKKTLGNKKLLYQYFGVYQVARNADASNLQNCLRC
ncbi:hypothetical protein COL03_18815 [Bacillus thuringiensis]|nr:hypothetical protein COL03_18815 [Bacillus thuringiensis]